MIVLVEDGLDEIYEALSTIHECEVYYTKDYKGIGDAMIYKNANCVKNDYMGEMNRFYNSVDYQKGINKGVLLICARNKDKDEIRTIIMRHIMLEND